MRSAVLVTLAAAGCSAFAPAAAPRRATTSVSAAEMSRSMPFMLKPKGLDGMVGGEAQFDPLGFADMFDVRWLREAEIKHCRVAMLATVGFVMGEINSVPTAEWSTNSFTAGNPVNALNVVGAQGMLQVLAFCGFIEFATNGGKITQMDMFEGGRVPGEVKQTGPWTKAKLAPDAYERKQLIELTNGRLAMCGIGGMIHHSIILEHGILGGV